MKKYVYFLIATVSIIVLIRFCSERYPLFKIKREIIATGDPLLLQSFLFISENLDIGGQKDLLAYQDGKSVLQRDIEFSVNSCREQLDNGELQLHVFFEYVLPPVVDGEPYENWKESCAFEFSFISDRKDDMKFVCDTVNSYLGKNFTFVNTASEEGVKWSEYRLMQKGDCYDMVKKVVFPFRALGHACTIDYVIAWGSANGRHFWNSVYYEGKMMPFMGLEKNIFDYEPFRAHLHTADLTKTEYRYPGKVLRKTFSINREYAKMKKKYMPATLFMTLFYDLYFTDVTSEYFEVSDVRLSSNKKDGIMFLAVYNNHKWIPIAAKEVKGKEIVFENMKRQMLYVMIDINNIIHSDPFIIDKNGEIEFLSPAMNKKIDIKIEFMNPRMIEYLNARANPSAYPEDIFIGIAEDYYRERPQNGSLYQLFIFDKEWCLISESIAQNEELTFKNVPGNALYLIKGNNKTGSRCFTYENNQVVWW